MLETILISLVSAFITMDAVIFGQFGISRPIVSGPVVGFLVGEPLLGLHIGAILELIWINTIPIGTTLVPDVTSATIISVVWGSKILPLMHHLVPPTRTGAVAAFCMAVALPVSLIFRKLDLIQRIRASRFNEKLEEAIKRGEYSAIGKAIFLSSAEHYVRNFFLFMVSFYSVAFLKPLMTVLPDCILDGLVFGYRLLPAVGIGVFVYNFYDSVIKIIKR